MQRYTQGMMDLGATVCLAKRPMCLLCPLANDCVAKRQGTPDKYPVKTRKLKRTSQSIWLLWAQAESTENMQGDAVFLQKRPTPGVWAGLYCFVLFDSHAALLESVPARYHATVQDQTVFTHVLTHKDLYLHPVKVILPTSALEGQAGQWFTADEWPGLGLPAPVRKLLLAASSAASSTVKPAR
jgi:A/G-specific adenine glycosylase